MVKMSQYVFPILFSLCVIHVDIVRTFELDWLRNKKTRFLDPFLSIFKINLKRYKYTSKTPVRWTGQCLGLGPRV